MSATRELENITYRRLGVLLIAIGVVLAVSSHLGLDFVYKLWPVLTLGLGIGFVGIFAKRRGSGALYLVLGEYLILFSGLAFYCNFTTWRNLTQLWPVFITFLAVVFGTLFLIGRRSRFVLFIALLLLLSSLFFLLLMSMGNQYWWTAFILVGLSVLVSGRGK